MSLSSFTATVCPLADTVDTDESSFFDGRPLDAHKIGWIVAGSSAALTTLITIYSVSCHLRYYTVPKEQRQIVRILLMPPVYAIVSFFSYRFYREYSYYSLVLSIYEAIVLASFLMLLLYYIGSTNVDQRRALQEKEKRRIPFPLCCIRYRASKPYFLHAIRFSLLQYCFLRPVLSIVGIITQYYNLLCANIFSIYFAELWLDAIDFISISVALYGLVVFYALTRENLRGRSPLVKFLSIKAIVFFTFYQSFVFSQLASRGILKPTQYWTSVNVADGLQALATCCEMVAFSIVFLFAFSAEPYLTIISTRPHPFYALLEVLNFGDLFVELWNAIVFGVRHALRRPGTRRSGTTASAFDIDGAFKMKVPSSQRNSIEDQDLDAQWRSGQMNRSERGSEMTMIDLTGQKEAKYEREGDLGRIDGLHANETTAGFEEGDDPFISYGSAM